ncbi:hypothetical protein [Agromyces sp. S2-1-8]|uniref:hypothetical protein n=1 Tax=Agromyces sp. S2-1-8 TaxID=2897180 RepID=UPI001E5607A3|nr:hypothetical protein [Agromyces sp. S2-1-8]MCD5345537.1 hypothetical protein [Agromyces sp. S2-1-8]
MPAGYIIVGTGAGAGREFGRDRRPQCLHTPSEFTQGFGHPHQAVVAIDRASPTGSTGPAAPAAKAPDHTASTPSSAAETPISAGIASAAAIPRVHPEVARIRRDIRNCGQ